MTVNNDQVMYIVKYEGNSKSFHTFFPPFPQLNVVWKVTAI
jgi:hypothetical protein